MSCLCGTLEHLTLISNIPGKNNTNKNYSCPFKQCFKICFQEHAITLAGNGMKSKQKHG